MFGTLLKLLLALPDILSVLHQVIMIVEQVFPKASGTQKLEAAVNLVGQAVPAVTTLVSTPQLQQAISGLVAAANMPGGSLAQLKEVPPAPVSLP